MVLSDARFARKWMLLRIAMGCTLRNIFRLSVYAPHVKNFDTKFASGFSRLLSRYGSFWLRCLAPIIRAARRWPSLTSGDWREVSGPAALIRAPTARRDNGCPRRSTGQELADKADSAWRW